MSIELDRFEYPTHELAQEAWVSSDIYGPDVLTGGTASADSEEVGSEAAKACDDLGSATRWNTPDVVFPHWWKYDLGVGVTKIVQKVRVYPRAAPDAFFKNFTFQGSNNNVDWDVLYTGQHANTEAWEDFTFANSTAYRYYKFNITDNWDSSNPNYCQVYEFEMMEVDPNLQCYSESIIVEEGSYSLEVIAKATGSLNETLTKTLDPTIDLSGLGRIKFYIRSSRTGSHIKIGIHDSGGTTTEVTPNITLADTWQLVVWDISAVADADKDTIDSIIITIVNAGANNTFYLDNMYALVQFLTATSSVTSLTSGSLTLGIIELLTATASGSFSTTGSLAVVMSLTGTASPSFSTQGSLTLGIIELLTATANPSFSVQGSLTLGIIELLTATASGSSSTTGSLAVIMSLAGTASSTFSTQGSLTLGIIELLTATASIISTVTGQLLLLTTNPAYLVWHLLVTYGELDNIQTPANVDIDYDVWEQWRIDCDDLSFALKAELKGVSVASVLEKIAYLTKSTIFVRGDGKFVFYRFVPAPEIHYIFDDDNTQNPQPRQSFDELLNYVKCYYGYDPVNKNWDSGGSVAAEDATSQANYGKVSRIEEDTTVWHSTSASAQEFCNRLVERYKDPREYCPFETGMMGFIFEPEDLFSISISFYDYVLTPFETKRVEFDLGIGKTRIEALNIEKFTLGGFRLDDDYWGLFDEDYNVLY